MPRAGPKRVQRYSLEFKRAAVRLSQLDGVEVQAVARALDIHPFMLGRWRREAREGVLRGVKGSVAFKAPSSREVRRLQELEKEHALLLEEHELLKTAIRFCSERARTSTGSSKGSGGRSR